MMNRKRLFFLILTAATAMPLFAYDNVVTHPQLTMFATQKSVLYTDGTIMFNLGLAPANVQQFEYRARVEDRTWFMPNISYGLSSFVSEGAYDEDAPALRVLNHFYDPAFDRPLSGVPFAQTSWAWATEINGPIATQDWSLADARSYLNVALTYNRGATPQESDLERGAAMAEVFLSLGHAVHHLQDMAQPQHVRNDKHLDIPVLTFLNYFVGNPSRFERYTKEQGSKLDSLAASAAPLPLDTIQNDRDFWFNSSNSGIAQYTNTNYVSQGTNFTMVNGQPVPGPYANPRPGIATDFTPGQLFSEVGEAVPAQMQVLCGPSGVDCTMTMYSTIASARASTYSIFDQDLRATGVRLTYAGDFPVGYESDRLFALNRFNFDDAYRNLVPMSVTYSAGLINHFFRGKLNVTGPAVGPYAVADHATAQGFTTVKVTVANATPGEALSGGTFQAIAHFHRNTCYKPDLSGEFTVDDTSGRLTPPCPYPGYRSVESYIRVAPGDATGLQIGQSQEMTFNFSDPIPFDATDLIIQVYFQGTVGSEANSFALGAADVSEATYATIMNATDVFELSGTAFYYPADIVAGIANPPFSVIDLNHNQKYDPGIDEDPYGGDIQYEIRINGKTVGTIPVLNQGRFARVAALVDSNRTFQLTLVSFGNGFDDIDVYNMQPKIAQVDYARNVYFVDSVDLLRSQTLQWDSVSYYHYFPTTGASLDLMPISKDPNALTPVSIQMTP